MSRRPSSRYSEMPMRVQDSRTSLVNATPQNKDNFFGKLNIPKPQSTTSERRTSFFGKGLGAGGQRNSMFGAFGGPEKIKDPRPLHDKTFVQQCIKLLCEFLVERGFPGSITVKALQSPSTKEFLKIFEFIYTFLDPSFQMPTAKVEEEIPRMLKDLGYPFVLSKSSMYSIGAPHTWPQALGALIWLIDAIKIFSTTRVQGLPFSDFSDEQCEIEEGAEYNKLCLEYCADTYNKFMEGADTFEDEDEEYINKLRKLYNVDEALLHSQQDKHRMLMEQVERLERESQTGDLQRLQEYSSTLEAHKTTHENIAAELAQELEAYEIQIEGLKQEKMRLQHILENQKFTPADIERINREKNELQQNIKSLKQGLQETEQQVWNEEVNLSKTKERAELKIAEYNKLGRKLKLIPVSAENACGHDFEIRTDYSATSSTQFKIQIQNPLKSMMVDVEDECSRLTNVKLGLDEAVEQLKSNIFDKENDLKQLREQFRRVDQQLELDMQEMALEEDKWATEVDSAESHCKGFEKDVAQGCEKAEEELIAAQKQYHIVVRETNEENRMVYNNWTDICSAAVQHLCAVENHCLEQLKRFDKLKEIINEDEADMKQLTDLVKNFTDKANSI
ncbi:hypothetical protein DNTS_016030 [Danionella cerebrum]|uniref:Kinetochore protein NDC80 n=1 Tax=Danionella cerebrum TaxID=2873325 RepID=A0A553QZG7_9TELE|nr:hypothetical protein DNTS_016030 [Danionella translucida]